MKHRKVIYGSTIATCLAIGFIVAMLVTTQVNETIIINSIPREWSDVGGIQHPQPDASGVLVVRVRAHEALPGTAYATNITNATSFAYGQRNTSMTGECPRGTLFDVVATVRFNRSDIENVTTFMLTYARMNWTCAVLGVGALTSMTAVNISDQALGERLEYMFVNFYDNNGGAGWSIGADVHVNFSYTVQAYR